MKYKELRKLIREEIENLEGNNKVYSLYAVDTEAPKMKHTLYVRGIPEDKVTQYVNNYYEKIGTPNMKVWEIGNEFSWNELDPSEHEGFGSNPANDPNIWDMDDVVRLRGWEEEEVYEFFNLHSDEEDDINLSSF